MKLSYMLFALCLLGLSCQKKKASKNPSIEIGNKKYAKITERDLTVASSGFMSTVSKELDIDEDGTNDIRFKSFEGASPGIGVWGGYDIEILHANCEIAGTLYNEERWNRYDTNYLEDPTSGQTIVMWIENRACKQLSPNYSLTDILPDLLNTTVYAGGETLSKTDYFSNEIDNLTTSGDFSSTPYLEYVSNDTTYYSAFNVYREVCIPEKSSITGYLGVKMKTPEGEKLGWIHLSVWDNNRIQIYETAIQL